MEGCKSGSVKLLRSLTPKDVAARLRSEGERRELTKSLLNILLNVCREKCIKLDAKQRRALSPYTATVRKLLSARLKLETKRKLLLAKPALARAIALTCP